MWDAGNLYLAFDITDDVLVQEKTGGDMWEGDHVEFWLDADLLGDYTEMVNSGDDFQFGFSPGNFRNLKPEVLSRYRGIVVSGVAAFDDAGYLGRVGHTALCA